MSAAPTLASNAAPLGAALIEATLVIIEFQIEETTVSARSGRRGLPLGAHLVTPRRTFQHHGIYVGGGRVIHYAGLAGGRRLRTVEEVSLEEFARGNAIRVCAEPSVFTADEAVRRARSRLGENCYRVLSNNCEHFCEWCLHGSSRSTQVESLRCRPLVRLIAGLIDARIRLSEALHRCRRASVRLAWVAGQSATACQPANR